jgi:ABC-type transporter Mla subunit MlaD
MLDNEKRQKIQKISTAKNRFVQAASKLTSSNEKTLPRNIADAREALAALNEAMRTLL